MLVCWLRPTRLFPAMVQVALVFLLLVSFWSSDIDRTFLSDLAFPIDLTILGGLTIACDLTFTIDLTIASQ